MVQALPDELWMPVVAHLTAIKDSLCSKFETIVRVLARVVDECTVPNGYFRATAPANSSLANLEAHLVDLHLALLRLDHSVRRVLDKSANILTRTLVNPGRRRRIVEHVNQVYDAFRDLMITLSVTMSDQCEKETRDAAHQVHLLESKLSAAHNERPPVERPDDEKTPVPPALDKPVSAPSDTTTITPLTADAIAVLCCQAEKLLYGHGATRCPHLAFQHFRRAALTPILGTPTSYYAHAWTSLGSLYEHGLGTRADLSAALFCYRRAAGVAVAASDRPRPDFPWSVPAQGTPLPGACPRAVSALARWHETGTLVPLNRAVAIDMHRRAAAAGVVDSQSALARLLTPSSTEARDWAVRAARQYDPRASNWLGNAAYKAGDLDAAAAWYARAADLGDPAAMNHLGICYESGHGVPRDLRLAKAWYRRAATSGGHAHAAANWGYLLWAEGRSAEAYHAFQLGVLLGPAPSALFHLGCMHMAGVRTVAPVVDLGPPPEGSEVCGGKPAVEHGVGMASGVRGPVAPDNVAALAVPTVPIPASPELGVVYFHRAACLGHVEAMRALAQALQDGRGCGKNLEWAMAWRTRADLAERKGKAAAVPGTG
ncbi:hypothetical protein GGF31_007523 [Allomyces arbusculus]|nr:hypothetical protein GGF31_007523 [Allomyces arbusculus]